MTTKRIKVAVNGFGVIGKRVAEGVSLQSDMVLAGIADVATDYRLQVAARQKIPIFAATSDAVSSMQHAGIETQGTIEDLLDVADVVVDCTPKGIAANNLAKYRAAGLKSIFQGGEKHALTGHSFVAQSNYTTALGRESTRVVSCNTTSIVRVLGAIHDAGLLLQARGVLLRRATDPWESDHSGIMNTIVPEAHIPSHQGPDAQSVRPELDLVTMAAKAAHTQTHNHYWSLRLTRGVTREELVEALRAAPRLAFIRMSDGVVALNCTVEMMHDLGRPRGDMWEVAIWEDVISVQGDEAFLTYQVDNQAIVIPETIDAIRALCDMTDSPEESIQITDQSLGILRDFTRT